MVPGICTTAEFDEVSGRLEHFLDRSDVGPVLIERDGAPGVVMLAASEYERLARLDHVALLPSELGESDLAALRGSLAGLA